MVYPAPGGVGFGEVGDVGVGFVTPGVDRPEQPNMIAPVPKIRATPTSTTPSNRIQHYLHFCLSKWNDGFCRNGRMIVSMP
jgi:hypothetical protein